MAEVIRGGLQAIPQGQYEAARSIGLSYWQMNMKVVLPQAIRISIPSIVNTSIGLFKDTTLVIIVGLLDLLGIGRGALADTTWLGLAYEVYFFVSLVFFIFTFAMSRYSLYLEKSLKQVLTWEQINMSEDSIISLKNVNKWFGEFHVLKDVDLEVKKKERIVVCGPSGSGKSTMI